MCGHTRTQDLNPDCVSNLAKAAHAVDPIIIYGKDDDEETGRTTIPEDWKKLVMNWVIVGYYDKQAHPNKSVEQLQELINNARKEYQVFLFLEDEKFVTQELVQAARADNGRVFYQLADYVLPAFAPVGRMLCDCAALRGALSCEVVVQDAMHRTLRDAMRAALRGRCICAVVQDAMRGALRGRCICAVRAGCSCAVVVQDAMHRTLRDAMRAALKTKFL